MIFGLFHLWYLIPKSISELAEGTEPQKHYATITDLYNTFFMKIFSHSSHIYLS